METPTKRAASSYIITFFREVHLLLHNFTNYKSIIKEVESKYGEDSDALKGVTDQERNVMIQVRASVTSSVEKTYIHYLALCDSLELEKSDVIGTLYNDINEKFYPNLESLFSYVLEVHKFMGEHIMDKIDYDMMSKVEGLYGETET